MEGSAPAACAAGLFIKKDKKPDTLVGIVNYNFYDRHTYIHTYRHGDSMTNPAESVKRGVALCLCQKLTPRKAPKGN